MTRRFSEAERAEIWDALERGEAMRAIARNMGRAHGSIRTWVLANAGRRPRPPGSSGWLARAYPDDAEMRVSHETIYMSLFVQGRGALRQELDRCLRSGRALRRPKARTKGGFGQGQITNKGDDLRASRRGGRPGR